MTISGLGPWPKAASAEWFRQNQGGQILNTIKCTVVPGAPDAWITALERFGTMSFGEVASRSGIRFPGARGSRDGHSMTEIISYSADAIRQWPQNAAIYLPHGEAPKPGDRFFQADLAGSIQYMADEEAAASRHGGRLAGLAAARHAFYRGDIAQNIIAFHEANGGMATGGRSSLIFAATSRVSPSVRFGDIEVFGCGPWCQGPVLLQSLKLLDGMDLPSLGHNTPAYVHTLVEALKLAFADRHHYYGDPKFVDVPLAQLLSDGYAAQRRAMIDRHAACPDMPLPGDAADLGVAPKIRPRQPESRKNGRPPRSTPRTFASSIGWETRSQRPQA